jgi:non-ribosomal peptide synthetase component E (peptide arylation enzyme)
LPAKPSSTFRRCTPDNYDLGNRIDSAGFFAAEPFDQVAKVHPNKTAIIDKEELSLSVLNGRVHALAGRLHSKGIKQTERVRVLSPNWLYTGRSASRTPMVTSSISVAVTI